MSQVQMNVENQPTDSVAPHTHPMSTSGLLATPEGVARASAYKCSTLTCLWILLAAGIVSLAVGYIATGVFRVFRFFGIGFYLAGFLVFIIRTQAYKVNEPYCCMTGDSDELAALSRKRSWRCVATVAGVGCFALFLLSIVGAIGFDQPQGSPLDVVGVVAGILQLVVLLIIYGSYFGRINCNSCQFVCPEFEEPQPL